MPRGRQWLVMALVVALGLGAGARAAFASADPLELAYNEATANASITATTAAAASTVVSGTAITLDGATKVCVQAGAFGIQPPATAAASIRLMLWDGSTDLGRLGIATTGNAASYIFPFAGARCLTPAAGSHTYSLHAYVTSGTGNVFAGSGGPDTGTPAYVRVVLANPNVNYVAPAGSGTTTLGADDQHRLDLVWWGVWALVGMTVMLLLLPFWRGAFGLEGKLGSG